MELNLNIYETMALVSIVFYLGRYTRNRFSILSKYCVPPAVVGGFIFALFILLLHETNLATINLYINRNVFHSFKFKHSWSKFVKIYVKIVGIKHTF